MSLHQCSEKCEKEIKLKKIKDFPGILDLLHDYEELEEKERVERVLELRRHLSDLMILFRQAAAWLQPFDKI